MPALPVIHFGYYRQYRKTCTSDSRCASHYIPTTICSIHVSGTSCSPSRRFLQWNFQSKEKQKKTIKVQAEKKTILFPKRIQHLHTTCSHCHSNYPVKESCVYLAILKALQSSHMMSAAAGMRIAPESGRCHHPQSYYGASLVSCSSLH